MKFLKYKIQFKNINKNFHIKDLEINKINVINVNFKFQNHSIKFQIIPIFILISHSN